MASKIVTKADCTWPGTDVLALIRDSSKSTGGGMKNIRKKNIMCKEKNLITIVFLLCNYTYKKKKKEKKKKKRQKKKKGRGPTWSHPLSRTPAPPNSTISRPLLQSFLWRGRRGLGARVEEEEEEKEEKENSSGEGRGGVQGGGEGWWEDIGGKDKRWKDKNKQNCVIKEALCTRLLLWVWCPLVVEREGSSHSNYIVWISKLLMDYLFTLIDWIQYNFCPLEGSSNPTRLDEIQQEISQVQLIAEV